MRDGDLSNVELPRMWMVIEGLVLLPTGARKHAHVRDAYVMNTFMYKRVWDIVWRRDVRVNLVTFNDARGWVEAVQEWLDEVDFPAPMYHYTLERFMDEIVTLPSCAAVFDPEPRRALMYGHKGVHVDPHFDFDLFAI